MENIPAIKILNIKINPLTKTEVLNLIKNLLTDPNSPQSQLVTTNPEFVMAAQKDEEFKNIINNSWLSVADGYGIRLAGQYQQIISNFPKPLVACRLSLVSCRLTLGLKIAWWGITRNNKKLTAVPETITGTDLVPEICQLLSTLPVSSVIPAGLAENQTDRAGIPSINKKVFLLGGYGDVPRLAAERLLSPHFQGGVSCPEGAEGVVNNNLQIDYSTFESEKLIAKINSFQPLVLFVALNHPWAQKWIHDNLEKMPSVKLAIGVGGAFDYLSGKIKRAPHRLSGFEWLYRLVRQPRRWKRIYTAAIKFPLSVFKKNSQKFDKLTSPLKF